MWIQVLLGINIILGVGAIMATYHNIVKTKIIASNHLAHLSVDVKNISEKVDSIDKKSQTQSVAIAGIQSTCTERGKQLESLTK